MSALFRIATALIRQVPFSEFTYRCFNSARKRTGLTFDAVTYFGAKFRCNPADLIQARILDFGFWEPNVSKAIESILRPGDTFLDVGANIGYDSLLASKLVGPTGLVVAVEASPLALDILTENIHRNQAANIRIVPLAVSDRNGVARIYPGVKGNLGSSTIIESKGSGVGIEIQCAPIDDILTPEERSKLRLIKIDIEGAELPVMRRFIDTVALYPPETSVIVEASTVAESDAEAWRMVFTDLIALGFSAYSIDNEYQYNWYLNWRGPAPLKRLDSRPDLQTDILFTRDAGAVRLPY